MTPPNFADAPPLLTDADVHARVEKLVGHAAVVRQLWIMWVDGDGRQAPVVMPVGDIPRSPQPRLLDGLGEVLGGLRAELATELGPGSVILTLERRGPDDVLPMDRGWADALTGTCRRAGVELRGVFLSSDNRVQRLR